jgi:hypothetical protein
MGQVLHGCAKTTHLVRAELQRSKASVAAPFFELPTIFSIRCRWRLSTFIVRGCLRLRFEGVQGTALTMRPISA